jgi:hypothetical protein
MRILGLLALGVIIFFVASPPISRVRVNRNIMQCQSNMRQISLACEMYAEDNENAFPTNLQQLYPEYVDNAGVFVCPSDSATYKDFEKGIVTAKSSSYVLISGLPADITRKLILAYEKSEYHANENPGHQIETCRNVVFTDATVLMWRNDAEVSFWEYLAKQTMAIDAQKKNAAEKPDFSNLPDISGFHPPWQK